MNIIHSVFTTGWGGLEKYPLTLIEDLKKRGHNLIIVTIEGTRLHEEALARGIKTYTIKKFKKLSFEIISFLKEIVIKEKIDVVHMNSSREAYNWYFCLKNRKNIKLFLTFHIGVPKNKSLIHKIIYGRVNKIFAICSKEAEEMLEKLAVDSKKIVILHNGVDLNKFTNNIESKFREQMKIGKDEIVVTSVGNLSRGKGILEWVEVAKKIVSENSKVKFFWIGDDNHISENYTLESLRNNLKIEKFDEKINLLGYREDVTQILKGSDLFVLPSHKESFGIVYIEAMAMGLAVIGCNSGGVPDIIKEGTGFLCEPRDTESLYSTINKALVEDLKLIGESNIKYVEKFSMDKHMDKLLNVYGEK